jgi:acetate kinase
MNILILNSGSSTLKFKLFSMPSENMIAEGILKNYSGKAIEFNLKSAEVNLNIDIDQNVWEHRVSYIFNSLKSSKAIRSIDDINLIAHRVVHGGEEFKEPTLIDQSSLDTLRGYSEFAPLHNPVALKIIDEVRANYPSIQQIAVFDTSFNLSVEKENYLYGLPIEYYEQFKVRRYGFHGISHKYVSGKIKEISHKSDSKVISCHLGSGSSICAIIGDKSIDNSFGFSPNENLIMATRSGDIDFDAMIYLKKKLKIDDQQVDDIINNKSGLIGISGYSKDMKVLLGDYSKNENAKLAIDMYVSRIVDYISQYYVKLQGCNYLVFTGGIGSGSDVIRKMICERVDLLGFQIDNLKNTGQIDVSNELDVTKEGAMSKIFVIPANEELQMARETYQLYS